MAAALTAAFTSEDLEDETPSVFGDDISEAPLATPDDPAFLFVDTFVSPMMTIRCVDVSEIEKTTQATDSPV